MQQVLINKEPIFTRNFFNVTIINFIVFFCFQMIFPILPLYIKQLGGNDTMIGMVLGIFTISTIVARPLSGYLLDKVSKKLVLLVGLTIFVCAMFAYGMATTVGFILLIRLLHGFGWGFAGTATSTIASSIIPKSRFGEGMGYFSLANSLSMAIAPAVGIHVGLIYDNKMVFWVSAAIALLALLASLFLKCDAKPQIETDPKEKGIYEKKAIVPALLLFFTSMSYGGVISFLPLYAAQKGITDVSGFFMIYALSILLTRPSIGRMVDRYGFDIAIIPGFFCLAVSLLLLYNLRTNEVLMIVAVLYGISFGALLTSLQTMAVRDVESRRIGAANATLFTGNDLGMGIGVMVLGVVADHYGYDRMYMFTAIPLFAALAFYIFYVRRKRSVNAGR